MAEAVATELLRHSGTAAQRHGDQSNNGIVDLGSDLVIVPSAFASRMLQEALAKQAGALMLPQITTPNLFLSGKNFLNDDSDQAEPEEVAGKEAMLLAWVAVLTAPGFNRADYPALFQKERTGPMTPDGAQAFAQDLMLLQDELGAATEGLSFAETAKHPAWSKGELETATGQVERWEQLARLEELYLGQLKKLGLADHNAYRRATALSSHLPKEIDTIWLACVIDPQPLLETALARRMSHATVRVLIAANPEDADAFSPWGRPDDKAWAKPRGTAWKDFADTVHVVNKPEDGLERLSQLVRRLHTRLEPGAENRLDVVGRISVVPCDREVHPALIARELHSLKRGEGDEPLVKTANPLGRRHRDHGIHHAIVALLDLADAPTFANLRRCANHPVVAGRLQLTEIEVENEEGGVRTKIGWYRLQGLLDSVSAATPPQPLEETLAFARGVPVDEGMERRELAQNKRIRLAALALEEGWKLARELRGLGWRELGDRTLALAQPSRLAKLSEDEWNFAADVSEAIEGALDALGKGLPETTSLAATDVVRLGLHSAGGRSFRGDMERTAVNLPGWMEIPWEPVPHLVLFGLTDELVPGTRHAHPFLPAKLRAALGLGSPARQFANAAYALELVRCQRATRGRVDVIVPRHNDKGEGLRPSRLLMLSPERDGDTLLGEGGRPGRLDHLLGKVRSSRPEPVWDIPAAHRLDPTMLLPADKDRAERQLGRLRGSISATAFKTYLESPSDFWLKHALGMSESSHEAVELDAAGFGNLVHAAVEDFGLDPTTRDLLDEATIRKALESKLESHFKERFGSAPGGSLLLQREMARARLRSFALTQAELRQEGWSIMEVEGALPEIEIAKGLKLRGRFDRLDRNADGKRFRVYDYKSFARAQNPQPRHVQKSKVKEELGYFEIPSTSKTAKGKMLGKRWRDLQLPAYDWALTAGHPAVSKGVLEVGYLCLSGEANPEVIQVWDDFEEVYRAEARACMTEIAERLAAGTPEAFQPGAKPARYPVLEHLGGRALEAYLDPTKLGGTESERV